MSTASSAPGEAVPSPQLVTRLLRAQAPQLADLPVRPSAASGSSNWVFRIGEALAIRLPRSGHYVADLENEVRWLPRLAPELPVPVPDLVAVGQPSRAFPRPWAVVSWVPGEAPLDLDARRQTLLAETLGSFLISLHAADTSGAPSGPEDWGYRCGEPVTDTIDLWADEAAAQLADVFDPNSVREAWRRLRDVPEASAPGCWVHTDVSEENVLVHGDGRLAGVIDFGGVGVGDRAVDLLYAWSMFGPAARETLRLASGADEATWTRARAWAFVGPGVATLAHYRHDMPARGKRLSSMIETIAGEVGVRLR